MSKPTRDLRPLLDPLWNRLRSVTALTEADNQRLIRSCGDQAVHRRGADGPTMGLHVITSGWACRMRRMASGRRQIFVFLLPGDIIGSFGARSEFAFFRTVALTRLETIDMSRLLAEDAQRGVQTLVDAGLQAEDHARGLLYGHMMRLGAGDAYSGMAHLLLELHDRLLRAALVEVAGDYTLPVGQRVLAQALGVSVTHINNTLQRMVADGLIAFTGRSVRLLDRERMVALCDFDDVGAVADDLVSGFTSPVMSATHRGLTEVSPRAVSSRSDVSPPLTKANRVAGDLVEA